MKRLRATWILVIVAISVLGLLISCFNQMSGGVSFVPKASLIYPPVIDPDPIGTPDQPLMVPLFAGQTINVGAVEVWLEGKSLCVRYTTTWSLVETHFDVVTAPALFPQTNKGNPKPGQFKYKMNHDPGTSTYDFCVPMADFAEAERSLYFAAHAEVEQWVDGVCKNKESAWADGCDFLGANWATYFAGAMPVSINLTRYWEWFPWPDGEPEEFGPITLGIQQTNSTLVTDLFDFIGSYDGSSFNLNSEMLGTILTGTVSGSGDEIVITGNMTSDVLGNGTFRMTPFPEEIFGTLSAEGMVDGVDINIDTEFALGSGVEMETEPFTFSRFEVDGWDPHPVYLPNGVYLVLRFHVNGALTEGQYGTGQWWLGIDWEFPSGSLEDFDIFPEDTEMLEITYFDPDDGIAGNFAVFDGDLTGRFDVHFHEEWEPD